MSQSREGEVEMGNGNPYPNGVGPLVQMINPDMVNMFDRLILVDDSYSQRTMSAQRKQSCRNLTKSSHL